MKTDAQDILGGQCWKCSRCGWVACYTAAKVAKYGEPSECQDHSHESLEPIDLAEGWGIVADKALMEARKAAREALRLQTRADEIETILVMINNTQGDQPC